jgi:5-methyltetrahydropteroyltriglutamate--homocysteine methyltransferase
LDGVTLVNNGGQKFRIARQSEQPPIASDTGCSAPIMAALSRYLASVVAAEGGPGAMAKMTIPSPSMLHLSKGRAAISREVYPELDAFWSDVAATYRVAIGQLADAGCRYLQLDDITFADLCDPKIQQSCRNNDDDRNTLLWRYPEVINAVLTERSADMAVTIHTCRSKFKSAWIAKSGYDSAVEAMFSTDVAG